MTTGNPESVHTSEHIASLDDRAACVEAPLIGFQPRVTQTFVWINGTTEAGIDKVRINGQEFDVVGQFFAVRWNLPIQEGNYTFQVSVRDQAGNENLYRNVTEVHALPAAPPVQQSTPFYASPTFQVGVGAGLFGIALAALAMALSRRRETE